MLNEIAELARSLESEGTLLPVGFSPYREPLKWVVHIKPGNPLSVYLEKTETARPRPYSAKRTSGIVPYPLVDEAAYALGVDRETGGTSDRRAAAKHAAFLKLLQKIQHSPIVQDTALKEALNVLQRTLSQQLFRNDPRFPEILSKDWVAFTFEGAGLEGQLLFEHEEIKQFWAEHLSREVTAHKKTSLVSHGTCSVCNRHAQLVRIAPTKVKKLSGGDRQLMSLNASAFVSFASDISDAHLGVCLRCAEHISQTLNHLIQDDRHRKTLLLALQAGGKVNYDSPANQVAVFWQKSPQEGDIDRQEIELSTLSVAALMESGPEVEATLNLLQSFLETPWSPKDYALGIPDNRFFLAVLSPNGKGRIALREWIAVTLNDLKDRLRAYLQALKLRSPEGSASRPPTIPEIVVALRNAQNRKGGLAEISPNLVRGLLRTAYLGTPPPPGLLEAAVKRLRSPRGREFQPINRQPAPFQVLAAVLKLALYYGTKEAETMEHLNPLHLDPAYLCGRLLAVLEEAQRRAATGKLNTTLVDRFYGAAATGPAAAFAPLLKLAHTAHLPKIRRENRGYRQLDQTLTDIMTKLEAAGGFPLTLSLSAQAQFALGFYHQRAALASPAKED